VSLKRKLTVAAAVLLVAGGGTGAGLAASGHGTNPQRVGPPPGFQATHAGFVRASAYYLGMEVAALRHAVKNGRTIADIANAMPGRSAQQLSAYLFRAAIPKLRQATDRALSPAQRRTLHTVLRSRITGFLTDTCPLGLAALKKQLRGCPGMSMSTA